MNILVINCGSSSLKYQLLDMTNETLLCKGLVERIGIEGSVIKHEKSGMEKFEKKVPMENHREAIGHVMEALLDKEHGVIKSMDEINAVGHRIVHAGEYYNKSELLTADVIKNLEACIELAPLHNPANLTGVEACRALMPNTLMVGVFDTAFHQTMPAKNYIYALPYNYYEEYGVRRYGFHGTSHKYVATKCAEILGKKPEELKIITCHLGNGASLAAVEYGKVIDTSMGFTPLEGLVMGTRAGDLDPAILTFLQNKENLSAQEIERIINKESGVLGISGVSSDFRDIYRAADEGNKRAQLALEVYIHRVKGYLGNYMAQMNGCDAVVFTAGLGENNGIMRARICDNLDFLGIKLDEVKNHINATEAIISAEDSRVKVLLIPTNEELMIAQDTYEIVKTQ